MKVLIVAKTRRGNGACVGAITERGKSVRLISSDPEDAHAGMEYRVGEVWEIEAVPDPHIIPPHVENIIVLQGKRVKVSGNLVKAIERFMPPVSGGPEILFSGLARATPAGGLYLTQRTGLPTCSTCFWRPDKPLTIDCDGKRIHYRYPTEDGGQTITFVGFQEPVTEIPAGTLLRISLAHPWRPKEKPDQELRCFVQLSGWIGTITPAEDGKAQKQPAQTKPVFDLEQAHEVLKHTFGYSKFLPAQADVITRLLRGRDTLVIMPTGGGKSLCYQLPALLFEGLTLVVSPLIALMQDQVSQLRELEVQAAFLNSTVTHQTYVLIAKQVREQKIKLLYVAPETLLRPETLLLLEQSRLSCLAIDEAHCISQWGHDFRIEYRQLDGVRRRFPNAVCLALTATATPRVRTDILRLLGIPKEGEFVSSFNRQNLFLRAEPRQEGLAQTLEFLANHRSETGIIYCGTRKDVDGLAADLAAHGWPALPYHAGLDEETRRKNQEQFIEQDAVIMVATIAFGMGINKANVRFIMHFHLPKDIESYYQEIGRAGRDGLPADCLLLHSREDARLHRHFIAQGAESEREPREARLRAMMRFAETQGCRRIPLLEYFGESTSQHCNYCDNCRPHQGEQTDVSHQAWQFLECVQATGERFGLEHIISVMRGSCSARVLTWQHQRLNVYGSGKDTSAAQWRQLAGQLIKIGLLERDLEFGGLHLTVRGRKVLDEKKPVLIVLRKSTSPTPTAKTQIAHHPELFERLRAFRRELAWKAKVPPYIIFSDRTLMEMARILPRNETEFLRVSGVGRRKLERYGATFLEVIRKYCAELPPAQEQ